MPKGWIKGAIKHPGAFKAKAEAAGKTTREFAAEKAGAKGKLGQQARLAETLLNMKKSSGKSRMSRLYDRSHGRDD